MESDFSESLLHPGDLKAAVEMRLNALLEPIRKIFEAPELVKLVKTAYPPPAKVSKATAAATDDVVAPHRLDIRVGKIVEVLRHPEAESLYVEKIDLGIILYFQMARMVINMMTEKASRRALVQLSADLLTSYLNPRCSIGWL